MSSSETCAINCSGPSSHSGQFWLGGSAGSPPKRLFVADISECDSIVGTIPMQGFRYFKMSALEFQHDSSSAIACNGVKPNMSHHARLNPVRLLDRQGRFFASVLHDRASFASNCAADNRGSRWSSSQVQYSSRADLASRSSTIAPIRLRSSIELVAGPGSNGS